MQKFDHNIVFWEKRQFFRRKLGQIAENLIITSTPGFVVHMRGAGVAALRGEARRRPGTDLINQTRP
jgi:hypothetical protein